MTNQQFLQQFGHFIEAPNGIQKLRELILQLAVQGKLVAQDPNDEPASALLEKTVREKNKLINDKRIRKTKAPALPDEEPPHQLPSSWAWTNLYEIGEIGPRNEADDEMNASFVPMHLISDNYGTPVQHEVKLWKEIKSGFTHFKEEDVVLAKITPCFQNGKSAVMRGLTNGFGAGTTELHVYRAINSCTVPEYVLAYLKSPGFILGGIPKMTGTAGQKRVTRDYFAGNHFPLPPLPEQHRIVAKVDELMALCDRLETERNARQATHQRLIRTVHHPLTEAIGTTTGIDSLTAWHRIRDNFADLYTTLESVQALRQTILQLAVQGKLVAQDPNDEPASVLLNSVSEEKYKQIKEGVVKRTMVLMELKAGEIPFVLPKQWEAARFDDLFRFIDYRGKTPRKTSSGVPLITAKNIRMGYLNSEPKEYVTEKTYTEWMTRGFPRKGDLLFTTEAPMGNVCVVDIDVKFALAQRSIDLQPYNEVNTTFYMYAIMSKQTQDLIAHKATGMTATGIKAAKLKEIPLPIPPLAEQYRIVAKVEELMALCDQLEANIRARSDSASCFAEAIVQQIAAA